MSTAWFWLTDVLRLRVFIFMSVQYSKPAIGHDQSLCMMGTENVDQLNLSTNYQQNPEIYVWYEFYPRMKHLFIQSQNWKRLTLSPNKEVQADVVSFWGRICGFELLPCPHSPVLAPTFSTFLNLNHTCVVEFLSLRWVDCRRRGPFGKTKASLKQVYWRLSRLYLKIMRKRFCSRTSIDYG